MPKKILGGKVATSHSTLIPEVVPLIAFAQKNALIDKAVISKITNIGNSMPRLKIQLIPAGMKLTVRGRTAVQIIFIYTREQKRVANELENFWQQSVNTSLHNQ
jgi:hypothetical protein